MENFTKCPNCQQPIKSGWGGNKLKPDRTTNFINVLLNKDIRGYCEKCSAPFESDAKNSYNKENVTLINFIDKNIELVPILSTHLPFGWQFESISIVTGQAVTGTGFISEFKSSFTDFFGAQSGSFNKKIADGERLCFAQLRSKALHLGANAVIATDIDYGDVGNGKGMLLVCAAGTAVNIKNTEILGAAAQVIEEMRIKNNRLTAIKSAYLMSEQLF